MNKMILIGTMVAGMLFSSNAFAAALVQSGNLDADVTAASCAVLGATASVKLSNDVSGAFRCTETTGVINLATCHAAGSQAAAVVTCTVVTPATGGNPIVYSDTSCVDTTTTYELVNRRYFTASTDGGSISTQDLGAGTICDNDAVLAKAAP